MQLDQIEVGGDYPLAEVQERTQNFKICVERIDDYFSGTRNLSCTVGTFPEAHSLDYCRGGCPGALQEAIERRQPTSAGKRQDVPGAAVLQRVEDQHGCNRQQAKQGEAVHQCALEFLPHGVGIAPCQIPARYPLLTRQTCPVLDSAADPC